MDNYYFIYIIKCLRVSLGSSVQSIECCSVQSCSLHFFFLFPSSLTSFSLAAYGLFNLTIVLVYIQWFFFLPFIRYQVTGRFVGAHGSYYGVCFNGRLFSLINTLFRLSSLNTGSMSWVCTWNHWIVGEITDAITDHGSGDVYFTISLSFEIIC